MYAQDATGSFTLQQIMSAPYALDLTAAPAGNHLAWVENAQGVRNIWIGGAHDAARAITHYSEDDAQDINGLVWSPDASAVAYAYGAPNGANGKPANPAHLQRSTPVEVMVQPLAEGAPAVDLGEGRAPLFLHDGKRVLFVRGGEIWSADIASGAASARRLVVDRGSASGMTLSPDGSLLAYVSRRGAHSFIALYDLQAKSLRFVAPRADRDTAPTFSPDGKRIAWLRAPFTEAAEFAPNRVSAYPWSVMVADVAHADQARAVFSPVANKPGSVLPHTATGEPHVWWLAADRLAFLAETDGWLHLYAVSTGGGAPTLLTPGNGEVEDVTQGRTGTLMWASNVSACTAAGPTTHNATACGTLDEDRRHLWQLGPQGAEAITHGEGNEVHPQIAADGTVAALISDTFVPMHAALIAGDGATTPLREHEWPKEFPRAAVEALKPRQVLIPQAGIAPKGVPADDVRVSLHGQLFEPAGVAHANSSTALRNDIQGKHPALIFFHGGPMRQMLLGYPAMEYYSNAYAMNQYLASRGFIVLSVNYHCGVGYGTDFRQCEHAGAAGASEYADVLAAVKWLRTQKNVDPKRIGVWGGSYGGYLTALALARDSSLFAAGVDFHGVHDWILEDNNADWLRGSNAEKDAIAKTARASSPIADVARWKSPVLLIHGDNDGNVAFNQTPALAEALRARGVPVEELIFPDEIHEFLLHKDWVKAYEAEAEFFERILKP
jgi:dipeptidyl aminopeptidase/acylaminoacyl peptidase